MKFPSDANKLTQPWVTAAPAISTGFGDRTFVAVAYASVSEGERCAVLFVVEGKGGQEGRIAMYIGLGGLILLIILLVILF